MAIIFTKSELKGGLIGNLPNSEGELKPIFSLQAKEIHIDPNRGIHAIALKQVIAPHDKQGQKIVSDVFKTQVDQEAQAKMRKQTIEVFQMALLHNLQEIYAAQTTSGELKEDRTADFDTDNKLFYFQIRKGQDSSWFSAVTREKHKPNPSTEFYIYDANGNHIMSIEGLEREDGVPSFLRSAIVKTIADLTQQNMNAVLNQIKEIGKKGPQGGTAP